MKNETKQQLAAAGVFISLLVGAGFASGRELLTFFGRYGSMGYIGLFIACALLAAVGWAVMDITRRRSLSGYAEFMSLVCGKRLGQVMVAVVNVFIFVMMSTMFSGFGAALTEASGLHYSVGVLVFAVLCFLVFLKDLKGIVRVSAVLAPVLAVGGVFFGLYATFASAPASTLDAINNSFVWSAVIYASYNLLTAVSVLSALGSQLPNERGARNAAILSGVVIFVLGLAFLIPLLGNTALDSLSLPLLGLAFRHGTAMRAAYLVVLVAAVFTTAVSSGFAVIEWLDRLAVVKRLGLSRLTIKILVTAAGTLLAHIGFSAFIDKAYPLFGFIGVFQIVMILMNFASGKLEGRRVVKINEA